MRRDIAYEYKKPVAFAADISAASVIPLFYAQINAKEDLIDFLIINKKDALFEEFNLVCSEFYDLLKSPHTYIRQSIDTYQKELKKKSKEMMRFRELFHDGVGNNIDLVNDFNRGCVDQGNLSEKEEKIINNLSYLCKNINKLDDEINNDQKLIDSLKRQFNELTEDEAFSFFDLVGRFSSNPKNCRRELYEYFSSRQWVVDFIIDKKEIFKSVMNLWIEYCIQEDDLDLISPLLPLYLCPFNAGDIEYKTVSFYSTGKELCVNVDNVYFFRAWKAHFGRMPLLEKQLHVIQTRFGNQDVMHVKNSIENKINLSGLRVLGKIGEQFDVPNKETVRDSCYPNSSKCSAATSSVSGNQYAQFHQVVQGELSPNKENDPTQSESNPKNTP